MSISNVVVLSNHSGDDLV